MKRILSILCIVTMLLATLSSIALPVTAATDDIVNLFDADKATYEVYYNNNGATANNAYLSTDYIPAQNGDTITFGAMGDQGYHLVLLDSNKTVITRPKGTVKEALSGGLNIYEYTISTANVAYIRVTIQLSLGTNLPDTFLLTINRPFTNAERINFFHPLVNLFDATKANNDVYYSNTNIQSSASWWTSEYIPIQNGDVITFGPAASGQGYHLVIADANKTALIRPAAAACTLVEDLGGNNIYSYTVDNASAAYLRISTTPALKDQLMLTINRPFTNAERLAYFAAETAATLVNHYDFYQSQGNVIHNTATPSTAAGFSTSRAIKVEAGETIYMGPCDPNQGYHLAYFSGEAESTWLGRILKNDSRLTTVDNSRSDGYVIYSFTVPENVNYLRVPVANAVADDFILTRNQPFDEAARAAFFEINPLLGKSALFVGDSITDGTQDSVYGRWHGWAYRIGVANNMDWVNKGLSGTSISTARKQTFGTIVDQMLTQKDRDFDYVILHGGVNDAWSQAPAGEVAASFDPSTFDVTTFAGGLEDLIHNALCYYGDQAAIGYIMNFPTPNYQGTTYVHDMSAYYAVAEKVCNKWGIRFFDMYHNSRITADLKVNTTTYLADYLHPNSAGYDLLSPFIAGWMRTLSNENNRAVVSGLSITQEPDKTAYIEGQPLDTAGLAVTASYSNGTTAPVTDYTLSGYDAAKLGNQTVTANYHLQKATFDVSVAAKSVTGIEITQLPAKLVYEWGEEAAFSDLIVTATYNNGTTAPVTDYILSGFDSSIEGAQTITVQLGDFSDTFEVTIKAPKTAKLALEDQEVTIGDTVEVIIEIKENSYPITGLLLSIAYDDEILEIKDVADVTAGELPFGMFVGIEKTDVNPAMVSMISDVGVSAKEGSLVKIIFTAKKVGAAEISVAAAEATDDMLHNFEVTAAKATVTVADDVCLHPNAYFRHIEEIDTHISYCPDCKLEIGEALPCGGDYQTVANAPADAPAQHEKTCPDCSNTMIVDCDYNAVTTDATCENAGFITYTCKVESCAHSYTAAGEAALGHAWGDWAHDADANKHTRICGNDASHTETLTCDYSEVVTPPTCLAGGYTTYTCSVTGTDHSYTAAGEAALGHAWGEWVHDADANKHTRTCGNDASHTETLTCDYSEVVTPPTCLAGGYTTYTCSVTGTAHSYTANETEQLQHIWTIGDPIEGTHTHTLVCERNCGITDSEPCDFKAGAYVAPTPAKDGHTPYACDCGNSYDDLDGSMLGDVNGDHLLNVADAVILLREINGAAQASGVVVNPYASDVNGDDQLTSADVQLILQKLNGWNVEFIAKREEEIA